MIFKDKEIVSRLDTLDRKLDQLIAMRKADRIKEASKGKKGGI